MKTITIIPATAIRPEIEVTAYGDATYREYTDTTGQRVIDITITRPLRGPKRE